MSLLRRAFNRLMRPEPPVAAPRPVTAPVRVVPVVTPVAAPVLAVAAVDGTLDLRAISPRERHPLVFRTFGALDRGASFVLVNDHDPAPLRYQFKAEVGPNFGWEYLEEGPEVWRVRISREV